MADPGRRQSPAAAAARRSIPGPRRAWCCSLGGVPPQSPDRRTSLLPPSSKSHPNKQQNHLPPSAGSFHSSPSPSSKLSRGIIDPRRILSPGRVSPIDSDPAPIETSPSSTAAAADEEAESLDPLPEERSPVPERGSGGRVNGRSLELRLSLRGRDGRCVVLELDPEVICASSSFFEGMVLESRQKVADWREIEVADVEDLGAFRETIELMYQKDVMSMLVMGGASHAIGVLEVSSNIKFQRGIMCCLKYLEAVPWSESDEEKLKNLFARCTFDEVMSQDVLARLGPHGPTNSEDLAVRLIQSVTDGTNSNARKEMQSLVNGLLSKSSVYQKDPAGLNKEKLKNLFARCTFDEVMSQDVLARLGPHGPTNSEDLAVRLIQSVTDGTNSNARKEMQSLVNGLLSKSSVYQKDPAGLNKESLYCICHSCLNLLIGLFQEASGSSPTDSRKMTKEMKPLLERVSKQVENINWLLEIFIDKQMAEDFVSLWANQEELAKMHEKSSTMVRYELSRISACVFIALGRGKLQCPGYTRFGVLRAWFGPMLIDFGWLQRCSKGLDMRMVEESLGQALLTLPLIQQQNFFEEWFQCFSANGTECPNLSRAFQVWWRRSFVRSSEAFSQL